MNNADCYQDVQMLKIKNREKTDEIYIKTGGIRKKLSEFGLAKEKEIILISTANAGWEKTAKYWELKAAGYLI